MKKRKKTSGHIRENYETIKSEPFKGTVDQFIRKIKELVLK